MRCSIVLNNYNYRQYLAEAIDSVLLQRYRDYELIIVDDGSTDGSQDVMASYASLPNVRIIHKANGGQLSAFNAAAEHVQGELVFFLDSDDRYAPEYLERAVAFYRDNPDADFLSVGRKVIGMEHTLTERLPRRSSGYSILRTSLLFRWLGNATSAISMRKAVLDAILPVPFEPDWRINADDCLVMGASVVGAKKYHLDEVLTDHRVHEGNRDHKVALSNDMLYRRRVRTMRMIDYICEKNRVRVHLRLLAPEFASIPEKTRDDLLDYIKLLILLKPNLYQFVKHLRELVRVYRASRR